MLSIQDMTIFGILDANTDSQKRNALGKIIIFKLDKRVLKGPNKQFSFLYL